MDRLIEEAAPYLTAAASRSDSRNPEAILADMRAEVKALIAKQQAEDPDIAVFKVEIGVSRAEFAANREAVQRNIAEGLRAAAVMVMAGQYEPEDLGG